MVTNTQVINYNSGYSLKENSILWYPLKNIATKIETIEGLLLAIKPITPSKNTTD